ncbi:MAG: hypothetical protein SFV81_22245 [Pirellulaceae bacterium]|nr:hypothetical protein [Pirellulaceae bacterium]
MDENSRLGGLFCLPTWALRSFAISTSLSLLCGCGILPVYSRRASIEQSQVKPISLVEDPSNRSETIRTEENFAEPVAIDYPRLSPTELDFQHRLYSMDREGATQADLSVPKKLLHDQLSFYSIDSMASLGLAFGAGAAIANTGADDAIHRHFQSSVRNATSDDWFEFLRANKELGNGTITLPIFGSLWLANELVDGPLAFETAGKWGERSMRAFIVGAPPLIFTQVLTGGSRPYETDKGSRWQPFQDNNGVSGHAFMASLPFITAAKMTDDPWKKSFWYGASTLGPLSRVNDNAHYTSQIGLGWAIAYVAASAVNQTDTGRKGWSVIANSTGSGSDFALQYRW